MSVTFDSGEVIHGPVDRLPDQPQKEHRPGDPHDGEQEVAGAQDRSAQHAREEQPEQGLPAGGQQHRRMLSYRCYLHLARQQVLADSDGPARGGRCLSHGLEGTDEPGQ
jgi:hypothetical protein